MVLLVLLCLPPKLARDIWNDMRDWAVLAVYTDTGSLHCFVVVVVVVVVLPLYPVVYRDTTEGGLLETVVLGQHPAKW